MSSEMVITDCSPDGKSYTLEFVADPDETLNLTGQIDDEEFVDGFIKACAESGRLEMRFRYDLKALKVEAQKVEHLAMDRGLSESKINSFRRFFNVDRLVKPNGDYDIQPNLEFGKAPYLALQNYVSYLQNYLGKLQESRSRVGSVSSVMPDFSISLGRAGVQALMARGANIMPGSPEVGEAYLVEVYRRMDNKLDFELILLELNESQALRESVYAYFIFAERSRNQRLSFVEQRLKDYLETNQDSLSSKVLIGRASYVDAV